MFNILSVRAPGWIVRLRPSAWTVGSLLVVLFLYVPVFAAGFSSRQDSWAWSELHINYAAGFVRRGLLGEIAYQVQDFAGISTNAFFGTVFLIMTLIEFALLSWLLRPLRAWPLLYCLLFLSPGLVLFAAYDAGAYMRKDLFLSIGSSPTRYSCRPYDRGG